MSFGPFGPTIIISYSKVGKFQTLGSVTSHNNVNFTIHSMGGINFYNLCFFFRKTVFPLFRISKGLIERTPGRRDKLKDTLTRK
jgi:hypothetical protein